VIQVIKTLHFVCFRTEISIFFVSDQPNFVGWLNWKEFVINSGSAPEFSGGVLLQALMSVGLEVSAGKASEHG
jgi:hypothetical protein